MHRKKHALMPIEKLWAPMFPSLFNEDIWSINAEFLPAVNVEEQKNQYVVTAELPGFDPKEVKVKIEGDYLVLSGEHKEESKEEEKNYVCCERTHGSFYRKMSFPKQVNLSKAKGKVKNGLLTVNIPRIEETEGKKSNAVPIEIEK